MEFIIHKKSNKWGQETELYYLVENYREGKKVKRRTLLHLFGIKSVEEFLIKTEKQEASLLENLMVSVGRLEAFIRSGRPSISYYWTSEKREAYLAKQVREAKLRLDKCREMIEKIKGYVVSNTI
jgi:hypothetical protein